MKNGGGNGGGGIIKGGTIPVGVAAAAGGGAPLAVDPSDAVPPKVGSTINTVTHMCDIMHLVFDQFLVEGEGLAEEAELHLVVEELHLVVEGLQLAEGIVGEGLQPVEGTFQATS